MSGANNVAYEAWVRQQRGKLTPLQQAHVDALREADALCAKCEEEGECTMLCTGYRRWFSVYESDQNKRPVIVMHKCDKLKLREVVSGFEIRKALSGLTNTRWAEMLENCDKGTHPIDVEISQRDGGWWFERQYELPIKSRIAHTPDNIDYVQQLVGAFVLQGHTAKYVNAADVYRARIAERYHTQWMDLQASMLETDWLVLSRLDYTQNVGYVRQILCDIAYQRIEARKHLTLTYHSLDILKNNDEALHKEVVGWPELSIL